MPCPPRAWLRRGELSVSGAGLRGFYGLGFKLWELRCYGLLLLGGFYFLLGGGLVLGFTGEGFRAGLQCFFAIVKYAIVVVKVAKLLEFLLMWYQ